MQLFLIALFWSLLLCWFFFISMFYDLNLIRQKTISVNSSNKHLSKMLQF